MTGPLRVSINEAPAVNSLRSQLLQAKANLPQQNGPLDPFYDAAIGNINDLQSQLDALTNLDALGNNIAGPTGKAPTFSGPRIDATTNVGVDALKLVAYPGSK